MGWKSSAIAGLSAERPVLIAGPTASGKSALALEIASTQGGVIVNADALQVYADWRILTARPSDTDLTVAPHALYGHIPGDRAYSVGHWLRDVAPLLKGKRPIIVGGTGLYFTALTEGLADIPETPPDVRAEATQRLRSGELDAMIAELDAPTRARTDTANPMRVQRAWEVLRATGRGLADWQDTGASALLPLDHAQAIVLHAEREWLADRIFRRIDLMLDAGLLSEAETNAPQWRADLPSAKAIGAAELMAFLQDQLSLDELKDQIALLTRQYTKRQRSWFRSRMKSWRWQECH